MLKSANYFRRINQSYSNCRVYKSVSGLNNILLDFDFIFQSTLVQIHQHQRILIIMLSYLTLTRPVLASVLTFSSSSTFFLSSVFWRVVFKCAALYVVCAVCRALERKGEIHEKYL